MTAFSETTSRACAMACQVHPSFHPQVGWITSWPCNFQIGLWIYECYARWHLGVIATGFRARYEIRMASLLLGFATFRLMKYSPDGKFPPRDFSL